MASIRSGAFAGGAKRLSRGIRIEELLKPHDLSIPEGDQMEKSVA
jgi:hypothetical protein